MKILITGATGGIGRPLVHHLAQKGYELVLTARSSESLTNLTEDLSSKVSGIDGKITFCPTDFENPVTFSGLLPFVDSGLDGLVLIPPRVDPTSDCLLSDTHWNNIFKRSFIGPLALIRESIPALKKRPPAKVVIVSGISSVQVMSHYATANAIRAAWVAQAKTLAFAFGPEGIHFNTLSFGGVLTDKRMIEYKADADERRIDFAQRMGEEVYNVPLRKYASTAETSKAIEGLLSEFSDHMTGMNILCDGGFTRAY